MCGESCSGSGGDVATTVFFFLRSKAFLMVRRVRRNRKAICRLNGHGRRFMRGESSFGFGGVATTVLVRF